MSSVTVEEMLRTHENIKSNKDPIDQIIAALVPQFDSMMKSYVAFNLFFLILGSLELVFLFLFFALLAQSAILATSLALVFLTFFSYFILRLYLQSKKPLQFQELKERYIKACKGAISYHEEVPEHYVALASACTRLAHALSKKEYAFYTPPIMAKQLNPLFQKFSAWSHWSDVHAMQEHMLKAAIDENIKLVKCAPTSLAAHAALANSYVQLSNIYNKRTVENAPDEELWIPNNELTAHFEAKYRAAAQCATEEFKIINDFSPNDPWIHAQLANSYRDLRMPLQEINEYEQILQMTPDDVEVLTKLGRLYFEQGKNGQGLRIYEKLKQLKSSNAADLIKHYGAKA